MSRFEYFLAFETILYGLVLAHAVVGFSKMIFHRKTIKFYWCHLLGGLTAFLVVTHTYYSLFWVPVETIVNAWTFLVLRILPLTLMYISTFQLFPENPEGMQGEEFFHSRIKEILVPMVLYNMLSVGKSVYYRWDQYMMLGDGNILNSTKFWIFISPPLSICVLALLMIFKYQKKRLIEAFVVFSFIITIGLLTFGATSKQI